MIPEASGIREKDPTLERVLQFVLRWPHPRLGAASKDFAATT